MDWKWIILVTHFILLHKPSNGKEIKAQVNTKKWVHYVPERFLSMTIAPMTIVAASPLSKDTLNMAKGLEPGYVRLSGKGTNCLRFGKQLFKNGTTITKAELNSVYKFINDTGLDMILAMNPTIRLNGIWDSRDSREIISYTDEQGYHSSWQLAHEFYGLNSTGMEIGRDVVRLRKILDDFPKYTKAALFGPDFSSVTFQLSPLKEFLSQAGPVVTSLVLAPKLGGLFDEDPEKVISLMLDELDTFVWNKISLKGNTDSFIWNRNSFKGNIIHKKPVWIADPEPSKGTFRDAQILARKLGSAAKLGCELVLRQPGVTSLKYPTPEFWFALLYKNLVGRGVLDMKIVAGNRSDVYVYSHCTTSLTQEKSVLDTDWSYKDAITVFGVNESPESVKITMEASIKEEGIHIFILTSSSSEKNNVELTFLNGQMLMLSPTGELPVLSPKVKKPTRPTSVTVPGNSIFFFVMPDIKVRVCSIPPLIPPPDLTSKYRFIGDMDKNTGSSDSSVYDEGISDPVYVKFSKKESSGSKLKNSQEKNNSHDESSIPVLEGEKNPSEKYVYSRLKRSYTKINLPNEIEKNINDVQEEKVKRIRSLGLEDQKINSQSQNNFTTLQQVQVTFSSLENEQIQDQKPKRINERETKSPNDEKDEEGDDDDDDDDDDDEEDENINKKLIEIAAKGDKLLEKKSEDLDDSVDGTNEETQINKENQSEQLPSQELIIQQIENPNEKNSEEEELVNKVNLEEKPVITEESNQELPSESSDKTMVITNEEENEKSRIPPTDVEQTENEETQIDIVQNPTDSNNEEPEDELKEVPEPENDQPLRIPVPLVPPLPLNEPNENSQTENESENQKFEVTPQPVQNHIQKILPPGQNSYLPLKDLLFRQKSMNSMVDLNNQNRENPMDSKKEDMINKILTEMVINEDAKLAKKSVDPSQLELIEESKGNEPLVEVEIPGTEDKVYLPFKNVQEEDSSTLSDDTNKAKTLVMNPGNNLELPTDEGVSSRKVQRQVSGGPVTSPLFNPVSKLPLLMTKPTEPEVVQNPTETSKSHGSNENVNKAPIVLRSTLQNTYEAIKAKFEESKSKYEERSKIDLSENLKNTLQRHDAKIKELFTRFDKSAATAKEPSSSSLKVVTLPLSEGNLSDNKLDKTRLRRSTNNGWNTNINSKDGKLKINSDYTETATNYESRFNKIYPAKFYHLVFINHEPKSIWNNKNAEDETRHYNKDENHNNPKKDELSITKVYYEKYEDFQPGLVSDNEQLSVVVPEQLKSQKNEIDEHEQFFPITILSPKSSLSMTPYQEENKNQGSKTSLHEKNNELKNKSKEKNYFSTQNTIKTIEKRSIEPGEPKQQKISKRNVSEDDLLKDNSIKSYLIEKPLKEDTDEIDLDAEKHKNLLKTTDKIGKDFMNVPTKYSKFLQNQTLNKEEKIKEGNEEYIGKCKEIGTSKESIIQDYDEIKKSVSDNSKESNEGDHIVHVTEIVHLHKESPDGEMPSFASNIVNKITNFFSSIYNFFQNGTKKDETESVNK